jgi:hypothetical protein
MIIQSFLVLMLPVLTGTLIVHWFRFEKLNPVELLLKLSLGAGMGLGLSALLYFAYLVFFNTDRYFLYVEVALFLAALGITILKHKRAGSIPLQRPRVSVLQIVLLAIAVVVFLSSFIGLVNQSRQRAHGDWDAWMIYNRSARFLYRSEVWQDAFSKDMNVMFHADYPPLLALSIASNWKILSGETTYIPMFTGFLFSLATLGLCFSALASLKSLGQAGAGLVLLSGVTFFMGEGGRQQADVPFAFYILASIVFMFFYFSEKHPAAMAFAGFMTGFAAWTKNEGSLFLAISTGILFIVSIWKREFKGWLSYLAGMLLPLALLLYFKFQVAPKSEFLGGISKIIQDLTDPSRHQLIFNYFKGFLLYGGGWGGVGIYLILCGYFVLFHSRIKDMPDIVVIGLAIFACQIVGYYFFYLISPYDLQWHLDYSLGRLFVQIYPAVVFVILAASQTPEFIFSPEKANN